MSNYYAPCFYRIDFVVIPSYIELPCSKKESPLALQNIHSENSFPVATQFKSDFQSYNIFDSLLFYIPDDTWKLNSSFTDRLQIFFVSVFSFRYFKARLSKGYKDFKTWDLKILSSFHKLPYGVTAEHIFNLLTKKLTIST